MAQEKGQTSPEKKYEDTATNENDNVGDSESAAPAKPKNKFPFKRKDEKSDSTFGLRIGNESISRSAALSGGSYLYEELLIRFNEHFSIVGKYSYLLFPNTGKDHLMSTGLSLTTSQYADNVAVSFTPYFMLNPESYSKKSFSTADRHVAGKICFFSGTDKSNNFIFEFLPVTLIYNYTAKRWACAFEFISFGFYF